MHRSILLLIGLVSLVVGTLMMAPAAEAQEPPVVTVRTLVSQRVELLSQEPLCWNVFRADLAPGFRGASHAHALTLGYGVSGVQPLEYPGGPTRLVGPGEGNFIGHNNWHIHANPGTTTYSAMVFYLTCDDGQLPPPPISTRLGKTAVLPGIRPMAPYQVQLFEESDPPGSVVSTRTIPGPNAYYLLEGTLALSTAVGVTHYKAGDVWTVAPGVPFQLANVSNAPARVLLVRLWPVGERPQLLPDVRLPQPTPAALPRTGDGFSWVGPLAMLVGTLLLAVGIGLRRRQV